MTQEQSSCRNLEADPQIGLVVANGRFLTVKFMSGLILVMLAGYGHVRHVDC
jgi:hypothetical protein